MRAHQTLAVVLCLLLALVHAQANRRRHDLAPRQALPALPRAPAVLVRVVPPVQHLKRAGVCTRSAHTRRALNVLPPRSTRRRAAVCGTDPSGSATAGDAAPSNAASPTGAAPAVGNAAGAASSASITATALGAAAPSGVVPSNGSSSTSTPGSGSGHANAGARGAGVVLRSVVGSVVVVLALDAGYSSLFTL